jgi:hypothetical protein
VFFNFFFHFQVGPRTCFDKCLFPMESEDLPCTTRLSWQHLWGWLLCLPMSLSLLSLFPSHFYHTLFISLSFFLSPSLFLCVCGNGLSVCLSVWVSLSVYLYVCPSVCLSICTSVRLSVLGKYRYHWQTKCQDHTALTRVRHFVTALVLCDLIQKGVANATGIFSWYSGQSLNLFFCLKTYILNLSLYFF